MKTRLVFRSLLSLSILSFYLTISYGQQREIVTFNNDWVFNGKNVDGATINEIVTLPHTWNAFDAQEGIPYYRGKGIYEKHFSADPLWKGKRVFIRFEGVMTLASVYINSNLLGEHRGGYSAFCFEITPFLNFSGENVVKVEANNEYTKEVLPLFGDFNIYGGIYRPVTLLITSQICISPLDYASPGIYLKQKRVSDESADIGVAMKISNSTSKTELVKIETTVTDASGIKILSVNTEVELNQGDNNISQPIQISQPHLWNGKTDPYLYKVQVNIFQKDRIIDSKYQQLGIRSVKADPNLGFFLNGDHLTLHGVSRHQDREDKGSAISLADHKQDMEIMLDMGINALRLAHYQQSDDIYSLCDSSGVIVWAEIPWVGGPAGLMGSSNGYEPTEAFQSNARQQLTELILQNYNHPSICFWSIFNEIQNPKEVSPVGFINELNQLAKKIDSTRLTAGASMLDPKQPIHGITDVIAFNRYFGWYYKDPADMGKFLDKFHKGYPALSVGISEYGAGGSIYQHTQKLFKPNPFGSPHPEEYQSYYHEQNLKVFNKRPFVWGTFVWNMFDFGSQFRKEGDHYGINDKGLVTFNRKTKKDSFYFYKANWSTEDVLYITSKRNIFRRDKTTSVKIYSNSDSVSLLVNEKMVGTKSTADGIAEWNNIELNEGNNQILAQARRNGKLLEDRCVWVLETKFGLNQISRIFDMLRYLPTLLIIGLIAIFYSWYLAFRKISRRSKAAIFMAKTFFFLLLFTEIVLVAIKLLITSFLG